MIFGLSKKGAIVVDETIRWIIILLLIAFAGTAVYRVFIS